MTGWPAVRLVLLASLLLLAGCAAASAGGRAGAVVEQIMTSDGEVRSVEQGPPSGQPGIDEATARARAAAHVPDATRASSVQARFVALTMMTDREVWNFRARPVWLVSYDGLPFVADACACQGRQPLPTTVVVLDGQSGELVLVYGREGAPS